MIQTVSNTDFLSSNVQIVSNYDDLVSKLLSFRLQVGFYTQFCSFSTETFSNREIIFQTSSSEPI